MKAAIFITVFALVGSSVALSLTRASPPVKSNTKKKFDAFEHDHIVPEVRPLGVKTQHIVADIAYHNNVEETKFNQVKVEITHKQHNNQPSEAEIKHVELEIVQGHKPHLVEFEIKQKPVPHHVELEFKQELKPQHINFQTKQDQLQQKKINKSTRKLLLKILRSQQQKALVRI